MIKSRWILALLVALVCMAAPAMAQSAPFVISGHIFDADGNSCNGAWVRITNVNTSMSWDAENDSTSNYYQLVLDSDDASVNDDLQIEASGCSESKTVEYTVTQSEIDDGWFIQDITFEAAPGPDLSVTAIDAYHNATGYSPFFNLSNEVDVTLENTGDALADASRVSLYADDEFIGKTDVPALGAGTNTTVQFLWTPAGCDCEDSCSPITYTLKAIADCDGTVAESNEDNNESTTSETAYWAGYSADEHLTEVIHGTIRGGLYYTTGDGGYTGLYSGGSSMVIHYNDIGSAIPAGADIELARLNVYYTWSRDYPLMEVSITNSSGTYVVASAAEYNDRPCDSPAIGYDYPYGNYVYDITDYIKGESTFNVSVKNVGTDMFCPAAPGIVILYSDSTKPLYEYWLMEGADLLEGGRRGGAGNLDLSECICNATFAGSVDIGKVQNASLGIVSAWGGEAWGDWTSYYWFNDQYLGDGSILSGYSSLYSQTVNGITMYVGSSTYAQVGANVSDVSGCIVGQDNTASFGDNGDSMMAANAFLMVEYKPQAGICGDVTGNDVVNTGDVILLSNYVGYTGYTLQNEWAGDVTGNGVINTGDVILLSNYVGYTGYSLNCT
jgi:hypothetical protein